MNNNLILEVKDLSVSLRRKKTSPLPLLKGISFSLHYGDALCIVGESGCGKSLMARSIMGLLDKNFIIDPSSSISFMEKELTDLSPKEMSQIRGKDCAMIFQEPMTALNPVFTIGYQIEEMLCHHLGLSKKEAEARAISLLQAVEIPEPEYRIRSYPHELSGGMRQRAMIAMAIACNPSLLIADEPTTALDITVENQIISLLKALIKENDMSLILITHDLSIVSSVAKRLVIMYAGYIVEQGDIEDVFKMPLHPYTKGLLRSVPYWHTGSNRQKRLEPIPGNVPSMEALGKGCPFEPRCGKRMKICKTVCPELISLDRNDSYHSPNNGSNGNSANNYPKRQVRCHLYS